ncbi:MAG: MotA/TolQ/ExbB proton channel family protein [Deltaproteobacteria bacterium]|nr:MotA/TolQ/ExbB proton channel family protein [Deltaproteobacteria bacterium]
MVEIDLWSMISRSSLLIQFILVILAAMSVTSWTLIFFKLVQLSRARKKTVLDLSTFRRARNLLTAIRLLGHSPASPSYQLALKGMKEFKRLNKLDTPTDNLAGFFIENLRHGLRQEVSFLVENLFGSLSFLATCVNVAPFIGLFGTVWGIMHSFYAIGLLKRATLETVAPGLAEALITTAIGLAVAIPASVAYNFLMRMLGRIEMALIEFVAAFLKRVESELLAPIGAHGGIKHHVAAS